jgi:class 3 adenylate cyclase
MPQQGLERTKVPMHTTMNALPSAEEKKTPPAVDNNPAECSGVFDSVEVDSEVDSLWPEECSPSEGIPLEQTLAKRETKAVNCLRLVTILILLGAAILVSVAAYLIMKYDEEDNFEVQFNDLALRLGTYPDLDFACFQVVLLTLAFIRHALGTVEGIHANAKLRVQVIDMLAVSFTSSALTTNQVWPFVKLADFDARTTAARSILGSQYLSVYPYVTKELRKTWEEYTQQADNLGWLNESAVYQKDFWARHNRSSMEILSSRRLHQVPISNLTFVLEDEGIDQPIVNNSVTWNGTHGTNARIYRFGDLENPKDFGELVDEDEDAPGPFFPIWQMSGVSEEVAIRSINYNVLDPYIPAAFLDAFSVVHTLGEAVFAGVWNVDETGYIDENDDYDSREVPVSTLLYPIFDKVVGDDKTVVAVLDVDFEFGNFFTSVLPPNANSIICVVSNCDQVFSYVVTGTRAVYMGAEDLHDPLFDGFMASTLMADFDDSMGGTVYNGANINTKYCPWEVRVYATQDLKDEFVTARPLYYMMVVLGVFLFTCLSFIIYDRLVEHRQKKVMATAVQSDNIVSALFPKTFRDALYDVASKEKREDDTGRGSLAKRKFTSEATQKLAQDDVSERKDQPLVGEPLAMLYPECTVFFADIAGFTKWSSSRSPTQVFTLLETLYEAFDKLADKHHIFKIETVGDCYVCVTGLPEPQANHALLMVNFAHACLGKASKVIKSLAASLGEGTSALSTRIGLHSGPVTGGVLRGKKGRFQLFGDTVNTGKSCLNVLTCFCIVGWHLRLLC